jgi:phospholipase C
MDILSGAVPLMGDVRQNGSGPEVPRPQEDWPEVTPRPVPPLLDPMVQMDKPLPPLGKYLLGTAIALDTTHTGQVPDIDPKTATGQQARDYMTDRQARIWPGLTR